MIIVFQSKPLCRLICMQVLLLWVFIGAAFNCLGQTLRPKANAPQITAADLNKELHLYGQVVDQEGDGVANATVALVYYHFSPGKILFPDTPLFTVETDAKGCFDVEGFEGAYLTVSTIHAEGYEFQIGQNPYKTAEREDREEMNANSSPENRVILYLRRRMNPIFLLKHQFRLKVSSGNDRLFLDFCTGRGIQITTELAEDNPSVLKAQRSDLMLSTVYDQQMGEQILSLSGVGDTGAVAVSSTRLYEAPSDDAFAPSAEVRIKAGDRQRFFVYVRSRNPSVYSMLDLDVYSVHPEMIMASYSSALNPYGTKSLEFEPGLPAKARRSLRLEAEAALSEGRLPPLPDIPALLKSEERE
jgi:hypothetical protein